MNEKSAELAKMMRELSRVERLKRLNALIEKHGMDVVSNVTGLNISTLVQYRNAVNKPFSSYAIDQYKLEAAEHLLG